MKRCLSLLAVAAVVTCTAHAFTWGTKTRITGIYVYASGPAYITMENNQNPDNCSSGASYLGMDPASTNFRQLYATAMAAYTTGQTVSINYEGCLDGYPRVNSVAMPHVW